MKNLTYLISFLIIFLFSQTSLAAFAVPNPTGFLTDQAGKLSQNDKEAIETKLKNLESKSHNEVAILITPSLNGESIEDATYQTFKTWKVGKAGLDNGVLLVIAVADRKMRIETGKGVGGDLTDVQTQDIQTSMKPYLRKNDYAGACNLAVDKIASSLESRRNAKADPGKGAQFQDQPMPMAPGAGPPSCSIGPREVNYGLGAAYLLIALVVIFTIRRHVRLMREQENLLFERQRERLRRLESMERETQRIKNLTFIPPEPLSRGETLRKMPQVYVKSSPEIPTWDDDTLPTLATLVDSLPNYSAKNPSFKRGTSKSALDLDDDNE